MTKRIGANFRLTRYFGDEDLEDLQHAVRECWEEIHGNPDWVRKARSLK